jgi:hypothetical protein
MADVLIGRKLDHPDLKLKAGQVDKFARPPQASRCPICGQRYDNLTYHPNNSG